jgi:hypothetical protein
LRQRGGRDLPGVAGTADDGTLGHPRPAAAVGTDPEIGLAFSDAHRMLNNRISIFVSLPVAKLDRLSLQKHLDSIGKTAEAPR